MARRLGLIIGANQYQDPTFRLLRFAENDARAIAQWLVNTRGGKWAPGNIQHVSGTHATHELVESLITQLCIRVAEPGDLVFIYIAGHAFVDESSGESVLALPDTRYQNPSTGLCLGPLAQNVLMRSQASQMLFILDCFQTGNVWNTRRTSTYDNTPVLDPQFNAALQSSIDKLILCSCRGNDFTPEQGEGNLGPFVHQFIVGLAGQASYPSTGMITLQQIYNYLLSTLGEQQRPQLFGQEQSPLVLVGDGPDAINISHSRATAAEETPIRPPAPSGTANGTPFAAATMSRPITGQTQIDERSKQHYEQLMNQAQQLLQAQRFPSAFNIVVQALQIAPNDLPALILKTQILSAGGRMQDAFATITQIMRIDSNNATAWSAYAQLLSRSGQQQKALEAIERSLALDPKNAGAYSIKNDIMAQIAMLQSNAGSQSSRLILQKDQQPTRPVTYILIFGLQLAGLAVGAAGALLLELQNRITSIPGLIIITVGLLILCVNAWRSTYRYDSIATIIPIIVASLLSGAISGALYKSGLNTITAFLKTHPTYLLPLIFLGGWLIVAAIIPIIVAIIGLIVRAVTAKNRS